MKKETQKEREREIEREIEGVWIHWKQGTFKIILYKININFSLHLTYYFFRFYHISL